MPVGKIALTSALEKDGLLLPDTLYYWQIALTGNGVSPNWLPTVMQQIKSNDTLRFLPNEIQKKLAFTGDGLQSQVTHLVPFKATSNGRLSLPDLHIQFFNPRNGKIEDLQLKSQSSYALSTTWRVCLTSILCLILLLLVRILYQQLSHWLHRHRLRRHALQLIKTAKEVSDLRHALNLLSHAENWPANLTLREWAQRWQNRYRVDNSFASAMRQLSQACYQSNQPTNIEALRGTLARQMRATKRSYTAFSSSVKKSYHPDSSKQI